MGSYEHGQEQKSIRFRSMKDVSWLAGAPLASQKELYTVELRLFNRVQAGIITFIQDLNIVEYFTSAKKNYISAYKQAKFEQSILPFNS
jgi:hypothetical protein